MTSPYYQRALLLLQQDRYAEAEKELRQMLIEEPNSAWGHATLAVVLLEQLKLNDATAVAERAIVLDPEDAAGHYAMALVMFKRDRYQEAQRAIDETIRIDPFDPRYFALLGSIKLAQRNWRAALQAANNGLEIDPNHSDCLNIRGIAQTHLGDREGASETIRGALERDPENAVTHANQGWALLHRNQPKEALHHFREALRLQPNNEWARAGIVEAMKARNPIYRLLLAYFLFMARLGSKAQWGIIIGGYVGYQLVRNWKANNPELSPILTPLIALYVTFALSTWLAPHLFNLMLRLDRFGRYALSDQQKCGATLVGLVLLAAVVLAVLGLTVHEIFWYAALMTGMAALPTSLIMIASEGWPRWTLVGLSVFLLVCVPLVVLSDLGIIPTSVGDTLATVWMIALFISVFGGQAIASATPKR
jgi:tetratricopeptide (TPR) repeat protein